MSAYLHHQAACRAAADHCKGKGKNISKLALQYSLANTDISSILVGMKSVKEVIFFHRFLSSTSDSSFINPMSSFDIIFYMCH